MIMNIIPNMTLIDVSQPLTILVNERFASPEQYLCGELCLYFQWIPTTACYVGAECVSNLVEYVMQLEKNHISVHY